MMDDISHPLSRYHDEQYAKNGPCCSGCDYYCPISTQYGDCTRSAPNVSGGDRAWLMGIKYSPSYIPEEGHIITKAEHVCGEFKDDFEWATLGRFYLKSINGEHLAKGHPKP